MDVVLGLYVALAEDVWSINIGPRIPGLHFLEERDSISWLAAQVIRQTKQLCGLVVRWIRLQRLLERLNRVHIIALPVVCDPQFMRQTFGSRLRGTQLPQLGNGLIIFT